jgi:hypothetical protein
MSREIDRITATTYDCQKIIAGQSRDYALNLRVDLEQYAERSKDLSGQKNWQGWMVLGCGLAGGLSAILGEVLPNNPTIAPVHPRVDARAGITDPISNAIKAISEKLDNNFWKSAAKAASQAIPAGVSPAVNAWYESANIKLESIRQIIKDVKIQHDLTGINGGQSALQQIDQSVQRIFQSQMNP